MLNDITTINPRLDKIAAAVKGKWGREANESCTYVVIANVVFVEGDVSKCPIEVMGWHGDGQGFWGIMK